MALQSDAVGGFRAAGKRDVSPSLLPQLQAHASTLLVLVERAGSTLEGAETLSHSHFGLFLSFFFVLFGRLSRATLQPISWSWCKGINDPFPSLVQVGCEATHPPGTGAFLHLQTL